MYNFLPFPQIPLLQFQKACWESQKSAGGWRLIKAYLLSLRFKSSQCLGMYKTGSVKMCASCGISPKLFFKTPSYFQSLWDVYAFILGQGDLELLVLLLCLHCAEVKLVFLTFIYLKTLCQNNQDPLGCCQWLLTS